jgi:hypothetical protein
MVDLVGPRGLYPALMAAEWAALHPAVQELHARLTQARAELTVERGTGVLARVAGWVLGLPKAGVAALELRIDRSANGERWERRFGGHPLASDQWVEGGLLWERMGPSAVAFALRADGAALVFEQRRVVICLGPLRIPLPGPLAPRTSARAEPDDRGVRVDIAVRAFGQLLFRYRGVVHPSTAPPGTAGAPRTPGDQG